MEQLTISSAKYYIAPAEENPCAVHAVIDGIEMSVPLDPANRHYAEIMRQVEAGELTIQDADS